MRLNEFEKIINLLAKEHKVHIKEGENWACNIKDKTVFYNKENIYTLPEDHILGLTLHEIGHIHYTTDSPEVEKDTNKELLHLTMNS